MNRILSFVFFALCSVSAMSENKQIACVKGGEESIEAYDCIFEQHNGRYDYLCDAYMADTYVVSLLGKSECLGKEDGSDDACYFVLSLGDKKFKAGDVLSVTAMRNIQAERAASLYFEFSNGKTIVDENVWNNLGIYKDMTFGGDVSFSAKRKDATTQPLITYSMYPSTFDFVVPAEADGAEYVKITRNISETPLYISSIIVKRDEATGIKSVTAAKNDGIARNLQGIQVGKNYRGVVIKNGRKVVQ